MKNGKSIILGGFKVVSAPVVVSYDYRAVFPHSKLFWNATADMLQREKRLLICNLLVSMFPAIRDAICFHNFNN